MEWGRHFQHLLWNRLHPCLHLLALVAAGNAEKGRSRAVRGSAATALCSPTPPGLPGSAGSGLHLPPTHPPTHRGRERNGTHLPPRVHSCHCCLQPLLQIVKQWASQQVPSHSIACAHQLLLKCKLPGLFEYRVIHFHWWVGFWQVGVHSPEVEVVVAARGGVCQWGGGSVYVVEKQGQQQRAGSGVGAGSSCS